METEMETMTLMPGHPYFKIAKPSTWQQSHNGKWIVKWRDFWMVMDSEEFDTKDEAMKFVAELSTAPLTIKVWDWERDDVAYCNSRWHDLARNQA